MVYACGKGEIAAVIEEIRREDGCWITMSEFIYSHVRYKVIGGNSGRGLTPDTSTSVACSFSSEQSRSRRPLVYNL